MLITQVVQVKINNKKQQEYYNKIVPNINIGDIITTNPWNLLENSSVVVNVRCDYCDDEFSCKWQRFINGKRTIQKDACSKCYSLKRKEIFLAKYGVENPAQIESVKEKIKETNLKRYGCENVFQVKEFQEKMHNTMEEKYNVKNALEDEGFLQKAKDTFMERYGAEFYICSKDGIDAIKRTNVKKYGNEYAIASEKVKEKIKKSCQEKYGVDYPLQSKEIQEKTRVSLQKNGTKYICCSKQQLRLSKLYGCELNKKIGDYYADLVFDNIICEYDGGGHNINVLFGEKTQEDFDIEEKQREDYFVSMGYKLFRIINTTDKIMSDSFYLDLKEYCLNVFSNTDYNICYYNIKDNIVKYR